MRKVYEAPAVGEVEKPAGAGRFAVVIPNEYFCGLFCTEKYAKRPRNANQGILRGQIVPDPYKKYFFAGF